jgi:hypothetical protein
MVGLHANITAQPVTVDALWYRVQAFLQNMVVETKEGCVTLVYVVFCVLTLVTTLSNDPG